MEKKSLNRIPNWSESLPTEPGLYVFMESDQVLQNYPLVHLVSVEEEPAGFLAADCDDWHTWYPLIDFPYTGLWSPVIQFSGETHA